jgi:hypothetical protein
MLLGMCCQLTFNQFMASLVNPFAEKCPNYCYRIYANFSAEIPT